MSAERSHCPWCHEGYPEGRDDAASGWAAYKALDRIRQRTSDGEPFYSAEAMVQFAEDALNE